MAKRAELKSALRKSLHDEQFLLKMTKDDTQKLKEVVEYFKTDKSKVLRAGLYLIHEEMEKEMKAEGKHKFTGIKHEKLNK